jgi:hypothetical protein
MKRLTRHLFNLVLFALATALALPALAQEEPPGRVGRISVIEGEVWLRDASSSNPFIGTLNWPVTQGTAFETGLNARAEVRVGSTAVRLAPSTRARFDTLDDDTARITLDRGSVSLRFRSMENARDTVVVTPQGNVIFAEAGRYRVDVSTYGEVNISAMRGNARFDGRSMSVSVPTGNQLQLFTDGRSQFIALDNDTFAAWVADRDREFDRRPAPRYVSPELTGGDALEEHGSWAVTSSYGPVWYPYHYPAGWAPFRTGNWVWMQPWGWTWVDAQPWGFAVSHYGRWAYIDSRWGWVPGQYVARPVWAPALVAWAGGSRWSVSVNLGYPSVGWVPLAPYEVFTPYYAAPARYWQTVNAPYVRNVTVVNYVQQNPGSQSYANASVNGAVSAAASAATFARGAAGAAQGAAAPRGNTFVAVQNAAAQQAFVNNRIVAPTANPNAAPQPIAPGQGPLAGAAAAARAAAAGAPQPAQINPAPGTQRVVPPGLAQPQGAAQNGAAAAAAQAARSPNYIKSAPVAPQAPVQQAQPQNQPQIQPQPQPQIQRVAPPPAPSDGRGGMAGAAEAARRAQQQQQQQQQQIQQMQQQQGWQQRPEMRVQPQPAPQRAAPQAAPQQMQQFQMERRQAAPQPQVQRHTPREGERMERGNAQDAVVRAIRER